MSLFTPGSYPDGEEASGDGLLVSGDGSAGAGPGEKMGVCGCVCVRECVRARAVKLDNRALVRQVRALPAEQVSGDDVPKHSRAL